MAIPLPPGSSHIFTDSRAELSSSIVPLLQNLSADQVENTVPLLHAYPLLRERVYGAVAQKRPWYIHPPRGHCIPMTLHATV
jgi:hypothetical protein